MAKPKSINIADFTNEDLTKLNKIGIYKAWFINDIENRVYIGSALKTKEGKKHKDLGFRFRWNLHISQLKQNKNPCKKLQKACNHFGIENLRFNIIDILKDDYHKSYYEIIETGYISKYNSVKNGWNIRIKSNSRKGLITEDSTKQKISIANSGNKNGMFGVTGKNHPISKEVYQYNFEGDFLKKWDSARQASKILGIGWNKISANALNTRPSAYGYLWFYEFKGEKIRITENEKLLLQGIRSKKSNRPVIAFHKDGSIYKEFKNVVDANIEFKGTTKQTAIGSALCKGITAYGYKWEYKQ